jgi:hypothetical protein
VQTLCANSLYFLGDLCTILNKSVYKCSHSTSIFLNKHVSYTRLVKVVLLCNTEAQVGCWYACTELHSVRYLTALGGFMNYIFFFCILYKLKFCVYKLTVTYDKDYLAVIKILCYMELEDSFCCVASCLLYVPYVMLRLHG